METERVPLLSVIIPVRNEAAHLADCVKSILDDAPEGGIEVLVVDGMSDDGTAELAARLSREDPRVRALANPQRFVPHGMNIGIAASRGSIIGRIDGHCRVVPGYFSACIRRLRDGGADCVGGVLEHAAYSPLGRAIAAAMTSPIGVGGARFRTGGNREVCVDTLSFGVCQRDLFHRVGGFDETFVRNQDDEFNLRVVRAGGRLVLVPSVKVLYFTRESLSKLSRQYFQYGYWKLRVMRKHGRPAALRHLAPSAFMGLLGVLAVAAPFLPAARAGLASVVAAYALIVSAEGLRLRHIRNVSWGWTVLAIAVLHFSYGSGLLSAVVRMRSQDTRGYDGPTTLSR